MDKIINFSPKHLVLRRYLRFITFSLCLVMLGRVYAETREYIPVYAELEVYSQMEADSLEELQSRLHDEKAEAEGKRILLEALTQEESGLGLDGILKTTSSFNGVNILTVGPNAITGYGPDLDIVTGFIKELGAGVKSISRIEVTGKAVIGFELEI